MLFSNRPGNTVYLGPKTMVPRNLPKISRGFTNFFPKIYIIIHHYTRKSVWGGGGGGGLPYFCQCQCCLKWKKLDAFRQNRKILEIILSNDSA